MEVAETADELQARIRAAQEVRITDGAIAEVMSGKLSVPDAMKNQADWARRIDHGRDVSGYDPVLRWHCRM